ncbi:VOC family protein [Kaustia mangrovi]|uniref:VOC family protein n=2 Tax=Kaustia mangrovi TaxID=2593653 RepID=A0A7S8C811_9HYPH|nr:VOC family protein [Kaustia mangrovi]
MHLAGTGVILNTERYADCVAFYRDVMGLAVLFADEELTCFEFGGAYLMVETGGLASRATKPVDRCPTKLRFNTRDLDADCRHLERHGVAVTRGDHAWGSTAEFSDPDGNRCALRSSDDFTPDEPPPE